MRPITTHELLSVWEQGSTQPSHRQALLLLEAAYPESVPEQNARISLGRRDSKLLTIREWLFGTQLESLAACPACRGQLQLSFDIADMRTAEKDSEAEVLALTVSDYELCFRLPDSEDLAAIDHCETVAESRSLLLTRCLLAVRHYGREERAGQLPETVVQAVSERMAEADPLADIRLGLDCPFCRHTWSAPFDIATYFWSEIDAWAHRLVREVHILASRYGWSEADILSLSTTRRHTYLAMSAHV